MLDRLKFLLYEYFVLTYFLNLCFQIYHLTNRYLLLLYKWEHFLHLFFFCFPAQVLHGYYAGCRAAPDTQTGGRLNG